MRLTQGWHGVGDSLKTANFPLLAISIAYRLPIVVELVKGDGKISLPMMMMLLLMMKHEMMPTPKRMANMALQKFSRGRIGPQSMIVCFLGCSETMYTQLLTHRIFRWKRVLEMPD